MRWLKLLVTFLGILIVGCLMLLGYGFYKKSQDSDWQLNQLFSNKSTVSSVVPTVSHAPALGPRSAPSTPPATFGIVTLTLPVGCAVTDVNPDGERAYLTIGPGGECNRIVVVDTVQGRVLGTIKAQPGTSPGTAQ